MQKLGNHKLLWHSLLLNTTVLNDNCDYQFSPWLACFREFIDLLSDGEGDFETQEAIQASLQQDVENHFCVCIE